jgi:uncharacterized protein
MLMTALRIDVADLLARPSARRSLHVEARLADLASSTVQIPEEEPVVVDVLLERIPDGIVVRGAVHTVWRAHCSRCLTELERPLELLVNELYEFDPVEGDTYPIENEHVDLELVVRDSVLLELPLVPVCPTDCVEPAPTDLAEAPPDPRWAALSELDL